MAKLVGLIMKRMKNERLVNTKRIGAILEIGIKI
jgi:hypothetical protein